jgi:uncharacterized membrane protein
VGVGKRTAEKFSPIVQAIAEAEKATTGEIRVHLSRRLWDPDPYGRARRLFAEYGMTRTAQRNGVLLYINLRKRRFALVGDEGVHQTVGQKYWEDLAQALHEDLMSTHIENAVAIAVRTIGATLQRFFPADLDSQNPDELSNEVTHD